MVLQGAAASGKAHSKLMSGRETFPSLLRENCVTADVPSDPCWSEPCGGFDQLMLPSPSLKQVFLGERCDPISMAVSLIMGCLKILALFPLAAPAAGSSLHKHSMPLFLHGT